MWKVPWRDIERQIEKTVEGTFGSIFSSLDGIETEVQHLMDKDLDVYRDKIAEQIISKAAYNTGLVGSGAGALDLLPLAGWAALMASIAADFSLTLREDVSMLLKLAYLYGQDVSREDRKREAISLLACAGADGADPTQASREVSKLMAMIGTKHVSRRFLVGIGKKIGLRFFKRKLVRLIPGLGILISGGINYYSTQQIGEFAKAFYAKRKGTDGELSEIAGEIRHFQRVLLQVMVNMAKVDKKVTEAEENLLRDVLLLFGYGQKEQEPFLEDLRNFDVLRPVNKRDLARLGKDDLRFVLKQAIAMMYADGEKCSEKSNYLTILARKLKVADSLIREVEREVQSELELG